MFKMSRLSILFWRNFGVLTSGEREYLFKVFNMLIIFIYAAQRSICFERWVFRPIAAC